MAGFWTYWVEPGTWMAKAWVEPVSRVALRDCDASTYRARQTLLEVGVAGGLGLRLDAVGEGGGLGVQGSQGAQGQSEGRGAHLCCEA